MDELFSSLPGDLKEATIIALRLRFDKIDICNQIKKIGNAFVDWRYFHEKSNSIKRDFFNVFADVICQLCYQVCKVQGATGEAKI